GCGVCVCGVEGGRRERRPDAKDRYRRVRSEACSREKRNKWEGPTKWEADRLCPASTLNKRSGALPPGIGHLRALCCNDCGVSALADNKRPARFARLRTCKSLVLLLF